MTARRQEGRPAVLRFRLPCTKKCGQRSVVGEQCDEFITAVLIEVVYGWGSTKRLARGDPQGIPDDAKAAADD